MFLERRWNAMSNLVGWGRTLLCACALACLAWPVQAQEALGADGKTTAVRPSAGCGQPGPTGHYQRTITDGSGRERIYDIVVPKNYRGTTPLALVFGFHGAGQKGQDAINEGVVEAGLPSGEAIFVAPDGVPFENYGVGWNSSCTGYDMGLFDNMMKEIGEKYCIDESRVFAYGGSWGGDFTTALTCCRGDRFRAIAVQAASDEFKDKTDFKSYVNMKDGGACPVQSRASLRFTHATGGDQYYPAPLFATTSKLLQHLNGCTSDTQVTKGQICRAMSGCRAPVIECEYDGLGHKPPPGFGADTWNFFVESMNR